MPVTTYPAPHGAEPVTPSRRRAAQEIAQSPTSSDPSEEDLMLLKEVCWVQAKQFKEVLQSSFGPELRDNVTLTAAPTGFVKAAVDAYSYHHHLVVRPDHVWVAILTQLCLYVNANAETLRSLFVAHTGKEDLEVIALGTRDTVDFGGMALHMTRLLEMNIKDPSLRSWIMQEFSTTTPNDRVAYASIMMGTLQKYFSYKFTLRCGIPSVTLLGERQDWEQLLAATEHLPTFGKEPSEWARLLRPILARFMKTFDEPNSDSTKDFWQRIAHESGGGSGPTWLSGWITAFCFWDERGQCLFAKGRTSELELDGVRYGFVDSQDIPPGWASTPILVDDNGDQFPARMVAGNVATVATGSGEWLAQGTDVLDTIHPVIGWWMVEEEQS